MKITIPTVHLNGTSREQLLDGYETTVKAIRKAIEATEQHQPNARDYYLQDGNAFGDAVVEYRKQLSRLAAARDYFMAVYEGILDAELD